MSGETTSRRIHVLREDVANRIAAGEVIDRPFSIVRELIDNSLDAGATAVDVWIERGGLDEIRVADDGSGMDGEDLELCYLPHSTSKITTVEDLESATTLGFRGEALSSIGVSAHLEVTSRRRDDRAAHRLEVRDGRSLGLEPTALARGTVVRVTELFAHVPARRQFLKSAAAESGMCASAFLDKALAHPGVAFRFSSDGKLRHFLPAAALADRVSQAYPEVSAAGPSYRRAEGDGFSLELVLCRPESARRDRRLIQVFANGRRIWEYALVQAVEYGYTGTIPGGLHPVAFVFLKIDPRLVDFNVHPAKREARFKDPAAIHRAVVSAVRAFVERTSASLAPAGASGPRVGEGSGHGGRGPGGLGHGGLGPGEVPYAAGSRSGELGLGREHPSSSFDLARAREALIREGPSPYREGEGALLCLGQVLGVFLVAQRGDTLYLIDQHAAHERILFDRFLAETPSVQELLVPISFEATPLEARKVEALRAELARAGIVVTPGGGSTWEVTGLDERLNVVAEERVVEIVCGRRGEPGSIRRELCALAACRAAVRDGERLDPATELSLASQALELPEARCPHGRPVWHSLSRSELYRLVKREV